MQPTDPHDPRPEASPPGSQAVTYPVDAPVSVMAGVIFVTTGQLACDALGVGPNQVALTPLVAWRIAELLRGALEHPELGPRMQLCAAWQAEEDAYLPRGRVMLDHAAVHFGIEPLGTGTFVSVQWEHVPGLILQLEAAAA